MCVFLLGKFISVNNTFLLSYLSSSLPSAMTATRSINLSRSSSKTDWWNSNRGVPWRSRKGNADCRVGNNMPFSIWEEQYGYNQHEFYYAAKLEAVIRLSSNCLIRFCLSMTTLRLNKLQWGHEKLWNISTCVKISTLPETGRWLSEALYS